MRIFVSVKNKASLLFAALALPFAAVIVASPQVGAANLGVVLCGSQSIVTVAQPESDSVVTKSEVTIKGTVKQAAQIEVLLDDQFNNVVPLNLGQTTYDTSIQLTPGTHTIKLTAVNMCDSGDDGSATLIITYSPPPDRNADGEVIINPIDDGEGGGSADDLNAPNGADGWLLPLRDAIDIGLRTMDIRSFDDRYRHSQLSVVRALVLIIGLYLMVFGVVNRRLIRFVAALPLLRTLDRRQSVRAESARWVIGVAGVLLFAGALLL